MHSFCDHQHIEILNSFSYLATGPSNLDGPSNPGLRYSILILISAKITYLFSMLSRCRITCQKDYHGALHCFLHFSFFSFPRPTPEISHPCRPFSLWRPILSRKTSYFRVKYAELTTPPKPPAVFGKVSRFIGNWTWTVWFSEISDEDMKLLEFDNELNLVTHVNINLSVS